MKKLAAQSIGFYTFVFIYGAVALCLYTACTSTSNMVQKSSGASVEEITLKTIHMGDNGYVGFICYSAQPAGNYFQPDASTHQIRRNTTYSITQSDMLQLLEECSGKPQEVVLAVISDKDVHYYSMFSFSVDEQKPLYIFTDREQKKYKLTPDKLTKENFVLLVHKDPARVVLDKIIK